MFATNHDSHCQFLRLSLKRACVFLVRRTDSNAISKGGSSNDLSDLVTAIEFHVGTIVARNGLYGLVLPFCNVHILWRHDPTGMFTSWKRQLRGRWILFPRRLRSQLDDLRYGGKSAHCTISYFALHELYLIERHNEHFSCVW